MGLDMYLEAGKSINLGQPEYEAARQHISELLGVSYDVLFEGESSEWRRIAVYTNIAYWRKANAIHNWFVENVQGGRDECQRSYVSRNDLEEFESLCIRLLETRDYDLAKELLPVTSGFLFGYIDYDEFYWDNIEYTLDMIRKALHLEGLGFNIFYQSSW